MRVAVRSLTHSAAADLLRVDRARERFVVAFRETFANFFVLAIIAPIPDRVLFPLVTQSKHAFIHLLCI